MKQLSRMILMGGLLAMTAFSTSACSMGAKEYVVGTPVKVGLICLHDSQSTYDKNFIDGMEEAVQALGERVDGAAIIKTGVDENDDCYKAAKNLVRQGCNVIFADSFGHEPFILEAAEQFKNVQFQAMNKTNLNNKK